jgi:hypothetical protein
MYAFYLVGKYAGKQNSNEMGEKWSCAYVNAKCVPLKAITKFIYLSKRSSHPTNPKLQQFQFHFFVKNDPCVDAIARRDFIF